MTRALLSLVVVTACGGSSSSVPAGQRVGVAVGAALTAADQHRAPWRCAAPDGPQLPAETVGGWKLSGHTLHRDGGGDLTIATIADAGGAAPATIAALGRMKPRFAKADVVIALGGMGTTAAELEATLGALADTAPLVVAPGDLEDIGALTTAIKALRAKGHLVIDGRLAQRIELPGTTVALIAGTSAASRNVAGADGCAYRPSDIPAAFADLTARQGLRILAAAEAPRGTSGGEAVGELALTPGAGTEVDLVLHGPSDGAASRARTGGRDADAIALTPGTADATPRLPGPVRAPTAGLLSIHGATWSWKPLADTE